MLFYQIRKTSLQQAMNTRRLLDRFANLLLILLMISAVSVFLLLAIGQGFHGNGPIGAAQSLEPDP